MAVRVVRPVALRKLGEVIHSRRKALGMTQNELAARTRFHRNYVASIEHGNGNITMLNLIRLADGLETLPSTLLRRSGH